MTERAGRDPAVATEYRDASSRLRRQPAGRGARRHRRRRGRPAADRRGQDLPRRTRARRRAAGGAGRRGALPARAERRRQVHPDQGARRGAPAGLRRRSSGSASRSRFANPQAAMRAGIATIYQELDLVDDLSVAENVFLGHEPQPARLRPAAAAWPGDPGDPRPARPRARSRRGRMVRRAAGGRQADRQHGPRAVPRGPADHHGRAERRAGPRRGRQPVPDHPGADRAGHRGHLHLAPAGGDPRDRRPGHRAQGRPDHRGEPAGPRPPRPATWSAG